MLLQNKIAVTRNITENIFRSYFKCFLSANEDDNCNLTPLSNQLFRLYKRGLFAAMRAYTIKIVYLEFSHIILKKYGENYIRIKNYVSQKLDHNLKISKFNQINRPESECSDYSILTDSNRNLFISKRCPEIFELNSYRIVDCANTGQQEMTNNNLANWTLECSNDNYGIDLNFHCSCDKMSDQDLSLRTVSLREEVTDSSDNWVVTGIRFAVKNNGLMIQIQEGQLINETIDLKTVKWQTDEERILEKGIESVRLNYYVKSFNLDDIQVPFGEFVTGVKFMILNGRLTLAVRGTEMWDDFKSWPSINHKWHKPKFTSKEQRLKIDVQDFKNSAEIKSQTKELSSSQRNYIDLTVGLYSSNSSILPIIPFFDSQPVITNPPAPIGGVGLFYKSQLSYGGFIAFKYMSSKYTFNPQAEINCFIKNNS
ncbi:GSCOCG00009063001-RA-CDS [Cotesia congregata]|nr:GSCOCG00009063001-RA-CDS [Cotesia congregata]